MGTWSMKECHLTCPAEVTNHTVPDPLMHSAAFCHRVTAILLFTLTFATIVYSRNSFCIYEQEVSRWFQRSATAAVCESSTDRPLSTSDLGRQKPPPTRQRSLSVPVDTSIANWIMHKKARCEVYPRTTDVIRLAVPDEKVPWLADFPEYDPPEYTSKSILACPPWADKDIVFANGEYSVDITAWNAIDTDKKVSRVSFQGKYVLDPVYKVPRNPMGRTGLRGRGALGRWGPNHAADPVVTRWKTNADGRKIQGADGKDIAQFIAVKRRDNGEWALPGGMVDPNEVVTATIQREFGEEALNSLQASEEEKKHIEESVERLFKRGTEVYKGYVDDPRNTDNAWMETVAMNFHDTDGTSVAQFKLNAGDDAVGVQWMDLSHELNLYASHIEFLKATAQLLNASW